MLRASNSLIGALNFFTFLLSIPVLGGGIWLSSRANTDCLRFLEWSIFIIGVSIMVVSLAGFIGACYRLSWLLWLYLFFMFFIIAALIGFTVFAFAATGKGSGRPVLNSSYLDYQLSDYSGWLEKRVSDPGYWSKISSCIRDAKICRKMASGSISESPDLFYQRHLTPVQSGCCKPPTSCGYVYVNETIWNPSSGYQVVDQDCSRWSNDQDQLCYDCDSCKAGVLATIKHSWRKVSVLNIVVFIILVIFYVIGCAAFRNNKRIDNDEAFGVNRMTKARPSKIECKIEC